MSERQWSTIDKSGWGDGPWLSEPDKVQWVDEASGLDCLMNRNSGAGNWCGYVGVPAGHPLHGVEYSADGADVDVHGGLTFSSECHEPTEAQWLELPERLAKAESSPEVARYPTGDAAQHLAALRGQAPMTFEEWRDYQMARRICHVPRPGVGEVWWFGFDCAHSGDSSPGYASLGLRWGNDYGVYRTVAYVRGQVASLAAQLAALATPGPRST